MRNLEREIGNICRKVARKVVKEGDKYTLALTGSNVGEYLGVMKFRDSEVHERSEVGIVTGLAWTEVGGSILTTEVVAVEGKGGKPILTGKLGDVMQESAQAAMTYVRSRCASAGARRAISIAISTSTCMCPRAQSLRTVPPPASPWQRQLPAR